MSQQKSKINVYSECGTLKTVLVHRPGKELDFISPSNMDKYLFANIIDRERAAKEHDEYVKIMKKLGINVLYVRDLFVQA